MTTPVHVPRNYARPTNWQRSKIGASISLTFCVVGLSQNYVIGMHYVTFLFILLAICVFFWGLLSFCEWYFLKPPIAENVSGYVREQLPSSPQPVGISTSENPSDISSPHDMLSSSRQPVGISTSETPSDLPPPYDMVATLSPNNRQVLNILEAPPPPYDKVSPDKILHEDNDNSRSCSSYLHAANHSTKT